MEDFAALYFTLFWEAQYLERNSEFLEHRNNFIGTSMKEEHREAASRQQWGYLCRDDLVERVRNLKKVSSPDYISSTEFHLKHGNFIHNILPARIKKGKSPSGLVVTSTEMHRDIHRLATLALQRRPEKSVAATVFFGEDNGIDPREPKNGAGETWMSIKLNIEASDQLIVDDVLWLIAQARSCSSPSSFHESLESQNYSPIYEKHNKLLLGEYKSRGTSECLVKNIEGHILRATGLWLYDRVSELSGLSSWRPQIADTQRGALAQAIKEWQAMPDRIDCACTNDEKKLRSWYLTTKNSVDAGRVLPVSKKSKR